MSLPHPFDRFRSHVIAAEALDDLVPYVDIVEAFNARNNLAADDRKAEELARRHGLLTSAVSDAHTAFELGRTYNEIPEFDGTGEDFKRALAQGRKVTRRTTPFIHVATSLTKVKKRLLRISRSGV